MRTALLLFHTLAVASIIATSHAALSPGCSSGGAFVPDSVLNVTVGDRYYLLYIPVNYNPDEPAPLVLSFHGGSRIAEQQLNLDNLTSKAFNRDYIVAYPNGIDKTWFGVPGVTTDDIGFTTTVIDEISSAYCVDTTRIFATGKSQGGGFISKTPQV